MKLRLTEHVAWREIGGETFVIDLKSKLMYGLNAPAGRLWRALAAGRGITLGLREVGFLGEMRELGLVRGDCPPPAPEADRSDDASSSPKVVWREELRSVAYSCGRISAYTPACEQVPTT